MTEFYADSFCKTNGILHCVFFFEGGFTLGLMIISHFPAQEGSTALHMASWRGHHEICQYLIEHGASVDVQDKVRDNPYPEYALYKL